MSHKHREDQVLIDSVEIAEDTMVEEIEETVEDVIGVVVNCLKLNIRKEPSRYSEIAAVVNCLDEVKIDLNASTDEWYAVCTVAGIEGFCMKKYIAVRQ